MKIAVYILLVVGGLYALHRLALWLEQRGWLFYLNRKSRISLVQPIDLGIDPGVRHLLEAKEEERVEERESGEGIDNDAKSARSSDDPSISN